MNIITGEDGTFNATFRKYAGAWVPVVINIETGKRKTLAHCNSSYAAAQTASIHAKSLAGNGAKPLTFEEIIEQGIAK